MLLCDLVINIVGSVLLMDVNGLCFDVVCMLFG